MVFLDSGQKYFLDFLKIVATLQAMFDSLTHLFSYLETIYSFPLDDVEKIIFSQKAYDVLIWNFSLCFCFFEKLGV